MVLRDMGRSDWDNVLSYRSPPSAAERRPPDPRKYLRPVLQVLAVVALLAAWFVPRIAMMSTRTPSVATQNRAHGAQLVAALEQSRQDRGTYPARLDDLVPSYLPTVPPDRPGTSWWYKSLNGGRRFQLDCRFSGGEDWHYDLRLGVPNSGARLPP